MKASNEAPDFDPVLEMGQVQVIVSYSTSQLYRMMKAGLFPTPIKLGPGRVGWRRSVVEAWLRSRELIG